MTAVRVRGIYATAITQVLQNASDASVVLASPAISRRFDADFETAPPDVTVATSRDRQGVAVTGDPAGVAAVRETLESVAIDVFAWDDVAAPGAVFAGEVIDTNDGGAVVTLEDGRRGFLPFGAVDGYVEEGDDVRAQVHEPRAPWVHGRPVLDTTIEVPGAVASLVAGVDSAVAGTPDGTAEHELVRTTELLSTRIPADWGVRWERAAEDVEVEELDAALASAVEAAERLEDGLEGASGPGRLAAPKEAAWVWFGRAARFALDEHRRRVTETMPGHHRVKASTDRAGTAVDFAERLGASPDGFPFGSVTDLFGPVEGDAVAIDHGKPDGRTVRLGRGEVVDRDVERGRITVERQMTAGGSYDALDVPRETGDVATTRFSEGRWWYPTVYRDADGEVKGTYVNVSTPVEVFPDAVRYVDLHVDVIERSDGTVEVVDETELADAVEAGHVSTHLAEKATSVAEQVASALE
ncbi:MAG: DUF402 domain-containing protein [Halanaeroarchaeum sp.]